MSTKPGEPHYYTISLKDIDVVSKSLLPTNVDFVNGETDSPQNNLIQSIISKVSGIPDPPEDFLPLAIAKDWWKQVNPWLKTGWSGLTKSTEGKVLIELFETSDQACRYDNNPVNCGFAMGSAVLLAESWMMETFEEAFHDLVNRASTGPDPILYDYEADAAHIFIEDVSNIIWVMSLQPSEGFLGATKFWSKLPFLGPLYLEILEKRLPAPRNADLLDPDESPTLSLLATDEDGTAYVFSFFTKYGKYCMIRGFSPIDLDISDNLGRSVNKQFSDIPGAVYTEVDLDRDGDNEDICNRRSKIVPCGGRKLYHPSFKLTTL